MNPPALKEFLVLSRGQWDAQASPADVQRAIDAFYMWYERQLELGRMEPAVASPGRQASVQKHDQRRPVCRDRAGE